MIATEDIRQKKLSMTFMIFAKDDEQNKPVKISLRLLRHIDHQPD